ncbi:reverse transcriptase domain-containing protein [Tanacetum coccineum]
MEIGAPEARHRLLVSSKDSNKTDLLHLGLGRGRRVVCSIGWKEKNDRLCYVLTAATGFPPEKGTKMQQGRSIIIGGHRLEKLADIRRVKTERNPFTPRIRHFNFTRTRMPSHVKTYDRSGDPEDHLKLFQVAAKTESGAMPTWCHMFNSTLTGNARVWFDKLPRESIDSYEYLRTAFRENYLQQTKHIKDPIEIHAKRWRIHGGLYGKIQSRNPGRGRRAEMHEDLRIHARVTTSFLQGEVAAFSYSQKKAPAPWKQPEGGNKPNFKKGFKNKQRSDRKPDRFSLLTKTPKEIFALEKGKFKAPPPMVTPAEKRDPNKYCEFHADTGHSTDECMQLRKQIDEMIKSGKLSQFIKELKQSDKPKAQKKEETAGKDKLLAILMIQPWERVAK